MLIEERIHIRQDLRPSFSIPTFEVELVRDDQSSEVLLHVRDQGRRFSTVRQIPILPRAIRAIR